MRPAIRQYEQQPWVTEVFMPSRYPWMTAGTLFAFLLGAALSTTAFAGGADVSEDEIYGDGVTLTTHDGSPLDIDGDGNADLAIAANRNGTEESSRYYLGNGDGTFSAPVLLSPGASSRIGAAFLNADGFIDLVQARRDNTDLLFLGDGAGGVGAGAPISSDTTRTLGVAIGDLNNDGFLDVVTGNGRESRTGDPPQTNRFYLNDGTGTFTPGEISADADTTRAIALADLDGDGHLDVIVANDHTTGNSNRVYLNQFGLTGTVSFSPGIDFGPADSLSTEILIGDLDNDGRPDIVVLNAAEAAASPAVNRFFLNTTNAGVFTLDAGTNVSDDIDRTNGGVLADFDGDGDLDLAVANFVATTSGQSSRNRLYLNQFVETGIVSFAAGIDISDDEQMSHEIDAVDLNGDGHIDIVVGNRDDVPGVSGRDRRYLNNGTDDPFTNIAPVIDAQAGTLQTDEDTDLTIVLADVEVTDPDNAFPADFTLTVQAGDNYTVTDNTITPDTGFNGDLTVPVIVNDGTAGSDPFDLTVTVGEPPANNPPEFTSTAVTQAAEDDTYTYDITATDADGDSLQITAPVLPDWLTLTDNGDGTATLTGTPGADDVGEHSVSLQVSDSADSAVQDFTVTVEAADEPTPPPPPSSGGGGGSFGSWSLFALLAGAVSARRRRRSI